ncbi:conserved membrane hypothetical protein [Candidatus Zixiibacteriota bacterium]|nr:conserved membrane hypothetical protein [candidate division Zixibacteria bacterium]
MTLFQQFQIWLGAFLVLSLFSFLYKDNPFYKLAEHIFAGLSAGYYIGLIWQNVIIQQLIDPMFDQGRWWLVFPGILGLLMFTRFFPKWSWVSRISLAFIMGNTAGVFLISQLHGIVLPQTVATMLSLNPRNGFGAVLLALVIFCGVISTLIYFYFSKEHKGVLGATAKVGIWFIMISFGAHFGYTVMARISLLIGQVRFLLFDWGGAIKQLF